MSQADVPCGCAETCSVFSDSAPPGVQAEGALPLPERLRLRVRVAGFLSVAEPLADYRQPAAGLGRGQEVWAALPQSEHLGAGQQQRQLCGRHQGNTGGSLPQPAQHQPQQLRFVFSVSSVGMYKAKSLKDQEMHIMQTCLCVERKSHWSTIRQDNMAEKHVTIKAFHISQYRQLLISFWF